MMKKRLLGLTAAIAVTATMFAAPASAGPNARVNVVHGIPGVPVNVCVNGGTLAEDFRFGNKIVGAALAPGEYRVKLVAAGKPCSAPAILRSTYTLAAGTNVTIVAALNASGTPKLKAFANGVKKLATGQARLTVRHTAQAPAVNVWANGSPLIDGTDFTWGANATVTLPKGDYRTKVTLPGRTAPVIGPATLTLAQGRAYQVYAVGSAGSYRLVVVKVNVGTI